MLVDVGYVSCSAVLRQNRSSRGWVYFSWVYINICSYSNDCFVTKSSFPSRKMMEMKEIETLSVKTWRICTENCFSFCRPYRNSRLYVQYIWSWSFSAGIVSHWKLVFLENPRKSKKMRSSVGDHSGTSPASWSGRALQLDCRSTFTSYKCSYNQAVVLILQVLLQSGCSAHLIDAPTNRL